jgi:hypothetical protein
MARYGGEIQWRNTGCDTGRDTGRDTLMLQKRLLFPVLFHQNQDFKIYG